MHLLGLNDCSRCPLKKTKKIHSVLTTLDCLIRRDSFARTFLQDHLQGFLGSCEGRSVDGEVAQLVLAAELRAVLQLCQRGERMDRNKRRSRLLPAAI